MVKPLYILSLEALLEENNWETIKSLWHMLRIQQREICLISFCWKKMLLSHQLISILKKITDEYEFMAKLARRHATLVKYYTRKRSGDLIAYHSFPRRVCSYPIPLSTIEQAIGRVKRDSNKMTSIGIGLDEI